MTKNEAKNAQDDLTVAYMFGYRDGKRSKSSIAQSIRDAAVNWDLSKPLSDVERRLLDAFCESSLESFESKDHLLWGNAKEKHHARTFMLLVAEALE